MPDFSANAVLVRMLAAPWPSEDDPGRRRPIEGDHEDIARCFGIILFPFWPARAGIYPNECRSWQYATDAGRAVISRTLEVTKPADPSEAADVLRLWRKSHSSRADTPVRLLTKLPPRVEIEAMHARLAERSRQFGQVAGTRLESAGA